MPSRNWFNVAPYSVMVAETFSALSEALSPFLGLGPVSRKILIALLHGAWSAFYTGVFSSSALYLVAVVIFRPLPGGLQGHRKLFMSLVTGAFIGVCAAILIALAVFMLVLAYCIGTYVVGAFRRNFSAEKTRLFQLKRKLPQPLEPFCPETREIHALEKMMETDTFFHRVLYRCSIENRLWKMEIHCALSTLEFRLARHYLNDIAFLSE